MKTLSLTTQLGTSASLADVSDVLVRNAGHSGLQIALTYIFISGQGEALERSFVPAKF